MYLVTVLLYGRYYGTTEFPKKEPLAGVHGSDLSFCCSNKQCQITEKNSAL